MERLPPDDLYSAGIPVGTVRQNTGDPTSVSDGIDWEQLHLTDRQRRASTDLAMHFHYANVSHFLRCGRLLQSDPTNTSLEMKNVAATLCLHKLVALDVWGRYMVRTDEGDTIPHPGCEYYQRLFVEESPITILVAMEILGCPVATTLLNAFKTVGDGLFHQLTERLTEQKQAEKGLVVQYLSHEMDERSPAAQRHISSGADQYSSLIMQMLDSYQTQLEAFDIDPVQIQEEVWTAINQFYDAIGLDTD